jgi:hypothetical protein
MHHLFTSDRDASPGANEPASSPIPSNLSPVGWSHAAIVSGSDLTGPLHRRLEQLIDRADRYLIQRYVQMGMVLHGVPHRVTASRTK